MPRSAWKMDFVSGPQKHFLILEVLDGGEKACYAVRHSREEVDVFNKMKLFLAVFLLGVFVCSGGAFSLIVSGPDSGETVIHYRCECFIKESDGNGGISSRGIQVPVSKRLRWEEASDHCKGKNGKYKRSSSDNSGDGEKRFRYMQLRGCGLVMVTHD